MAAAAAAIFPGEGGCRWPSRVQRGLTNRNTAVGTGRRRGRPPASCKGRVGGNGHERGRERVAQQLTPFEVQEELVHEA
eukprot:365361-Chlamydomonas_euryale.AAC.9